MKRPFWKWIGYQAIKNSFLILAVTLFRFRWTGKKFLPREGGALICSNHQSHFDPVLIGICFRGTLNFLARKTLFDARLFGSIIRYLDAIPIDRDGMSLGGIKETLKRLRQGEMVVLFPEGTRSHDGEVSALKPGFVALARRGKVPILPAAIDGAYDAWPRNKTFPRLTAIRTVFGPLISVEQIAAMSDEQLVEELRRRILACQRLARKWRGKPGGHNRDNAS